MHSVVSIGSRVRCKGGDKHDGTSSSGILHCTSSGWHRNKPPHCRKLTEKDPCCKVCSALCIGHRGKEWEVLLGYGGAALRCDGKIWDVLGTGGWAQVVQLTSVARVVGKQILKEVGLKLLLHFTDQSTEWGPSVFLVFFMWFVLCCARAVGYNVYSAGEGHKGWFFFSLPPFLCYWGVHTVSVTGRV